MVKKCFSLMIVVSMLLVGLFGCTGCGGNDPVIAIVNGAGIKNSEFREMFDYYSIQFGITDPESEDNQDYVAYLKDYIISYLVDEKVQLDKAKELGVATLSKEETEQVTKDVDELFDTWYNEFRQGLLNSGTEYSEEELDAQIKKMLDQYLTENALTREYITEVYTKSYILEKVYNETVKEVDVPETTLQEAYDARIAEMQDIYADDPSVFEMDYIENVTIFYVPEGYRQVKHILIALPDEVQSEIYALRVDGDDAGADKLRKEALSGIRDEAEAVLALLNKDGGNFEAVMLQHNDDVASNTLKDGYAVHKKGSYVPEFVNATFAMKKAGTLSGLIATDYGYHILYYLGELTPGAVPYDTVHDALYAELLSNAQNALFSKELEQWREEATVEIFTDKIVYTD